MHNSAAQRWGSIACCVIALTASGIYGWLQNGVMYPRLAEFFPIGREIDSITRALLYAGIILAAQWKPALFDMRILTAIAVVSCPCAAALLYAAIVVQSPVLVVTGLVFFELGNVWAVVLVGIALCSQASMRDTAAACGFGMALGYLLPFVIGVIPLLPGMLAMVAMVFCMIACTYRMGGLFLEHIKNEPASSVEIANPNSFLAPTHSLFLCLLLFNVTSGYALTLNEVNNAPISGPVVWITLIAIACWLAFKRTAGGEDSLFSFAVLLTVAGFLAAPLTFDGQSAVANTLLRTGSDGFSILMWICVAGIGMRNPYALLPAVGMVRLMQTIGVLVGAIAGHLVNDLAGGSPDASYTITMIVLFAFLAMMLLKFRDFRFEKTIAEIERPSMPSASTHEDATAPSIDDRCKALGREYGLTERETEIFAMLARGRNSIFIQEHYVISRNTVKTHVKRIYKKLEVHSQQELIDLVEARQKTSSRPEHPEFQEAAPKYQ